LKADRANSTPHPALSPIGREGKDEGEIRGIGKRIPACMSIGTLLGI